MKSEFALAFNEVLEEKQLPKEIILAAIEAAMVSAYRRSVNASNAQHVEAKVDPETGKVTIFAEKEVVEEVQDERTEVSLEEARRVNPEAQVGDMIIVEATPDDFGRIAVQTARQVIQQRLREAERNAQLQYFQRQLGEIVSGVVQAIGPQGITLGLDVKAEGLMPNSQKIPGERFRVHDRVRALVLEVKDTPRGPQIILSRAHRNFLRRLLENEVPEIYHGIVEIRAIAREAGHRAKVAVSATQPGVDPVGACVGVKGIRIQAIVRELHDEKIDIIEWNPDPVIYISKALSPARVVGVYLSETEEKGRTATVVVTEDQLSLAIGRDGQNARLAAKLTGWRIDIKSLTEAAGDAITKLQTDKELAEMLPVAVENIPVIEEILTRKAEGRPLTPEEYQALAQFVDRVERRTIQIEEDARRQEEERVAAARAEIPPVAFEMPLADLPLKEYVYTILTEAEYETVGDLLLAMKVDPDKVLGLPGIGPKAMQNIQETLAAITFPEPEEPAAAEEATAEEEKPAQEGETALPAAEEKVEAEERLPVVADEAATVAPEVEPGEAAEETAMAVEAERAAEADSAVDMETASLEEIFTLRPELIEGGSEKSGEEEEERDEPKKKKKKKKRKKKYVEIEYDPDLDEVIARKRHKRGDDDFFEEW
ncbi:MAG: transcription termination/antitermination protein NusA [Anaerolineae bacterium]|nr:MAG: transcription termination/antitermination protein NusA [Anaerolineae bacterium]